jgi:hypothetical protein
MATLIVLHEWTFTPSEGMDFEEVMKALAVKPNGGVLRFGNETWPAEHTDSSLSGPFHPLLDPNGYLIGGIPGDQPTPPKFRGPLCPYPLALPRPADVAEGVALGVEVSDDPSYAAAFELGRILALGESGILQALRDLHGVADRIMNKSIIAKGLPAALQDARWLVDPADLNARTLGWAAPNLLLAGESLAPPERAADFTGLRQLAASKAEIRDAVANAATINLQITISQIDITGVIDVLKATLEKQFGDLAHGRH